MALYLIGGGLCLSALYIFDRNNVKRVSEEIEYLNSIKTDAESVLSISSGEGTFSCRKSEKGIFEIVVAEMDDSIKCREYFLNGRTPLLRTLLFPPEEARSMFSRKMYFIYVYDDGDAYESFSNFLDKKLKV
jgi:hypothetical protein